MFRNDAEGNYRVSFQDGCSALQCFFGLLHTFTPKKTI